MASLGLYFQLSVSDQFGYKIEAPILLKILQKNLTFFPTFFYLGSPSSTCNCGCKLTSSEGFISSIHMQNTNVLCPWYIETKPGSSIILTIKKAENFDWTKGGIFVAEKHKSHMFTAQYGERMLHSFPIVIKSESNQLNVTLHYNKAPNKDQTFAVEVSYASCKERFVCVEISKMSIMKT